MSNETDAGGDRRVWLVIAGGGTGGHIYPGIAVAEVLAERGRLAGVHVLGSSRAVDARVIDALRRSRPWVEGAGGVELGFTALPARPPGLRPLAACSFVSGWVRSVLRSRGVLSDLERSGGQSEGRSGEPAAALVVLATGGFVSPPVLLSARLMGVRAVLLSLDAVPGRATRWAARWASRVLTAWPRVEGTSGGIRAAWTPVGPVVRRSVLPTGSAADCRVRLGLDPDVPVLAVTGGSQGAESLNGVLGVLARAHRDWLGGWQIVHQTGAREERDFRDLYRAVGVRARVCAFVEDMSDLWGSATLAICRAGAGTVAETLATKTPAIFLPYPYHSDEHQRHNAAASVAAGVACVVRDLVDPQRTVADAADLWRRVLTDPGAVLAMAGAYEKLGMLDGAGRVADVLADGAEAGDGGGFGAGGTPKQGRISRKGGA